MKNKKPSAQKLSQAEVIRLERDLAKFAMIMDSFVRIPFTKQGVGADAALSTIPIVGDAAGFILTGYAVVKAKQIGVPQKKLNPVIGMAAADAILGVIPIVGTVFDIMIRPSRKALAVVHEHIKIEYQINSDQHLIHPFLHEKLEQKQQHSAFWRNPIIAWLWLHIPDLIGSCVIILMAIAMWFGAVILWDYLQALNAAARS